MKVTTSGQSRRIALRGGGSLYVGFEGVSWMEFGDDERALTNAIADAMHAYEQKRREESSSTNAVDPHVSDPGTLTPREGSSS